MFQPYFFNPAAPRRLHDTRRVQSSQVLKHFSFSIVQNKRSTSMEMFRTVVAQQVGEPATALGHFCVQSAQSFIPSQSLVTDCLSNPSVNCTSTYFTRKLHWNHRASILFIALQNCILTVSLKSRVDFDGLISLFSRRLRTRVYLTRCFDQLRDSNFSLFVRASSSLVLETQLHHGKR